MYNMRPQLVSALFADSTMVAERTRDFIRVNFLFARPDVELTDDTRLMENRIVDSMGVLELIAFVEESFGIEIDDSDVRANFATINSIVAFVARRQRE